VACIGYIDRRPPITGKPPCVQHATGAHMKIHTRHVLIAIAIGVILLIIANVAAGL
jgi:hypothetical protein